MQESGVPYDDIQWQAIQNQPFGVGVGYNALIFGGLENIVDIEGPIAVEKDVISYRGMSVSFGRLGRRTIPYRPKTVRFLCGGNVAINGALTVVGNTLTSGEAFQVGSGSTYLIGKSGASDQRETLSELYAADGSPYWEPADHESYYSISSYDVPRRIPAQRVHANVSDFFQQAKTSIGCWQTAFIAMTANGTVEPAEYGYILKGSSGVQNVFDLTWPNQESIQGNLSLDVPEGSVAIVRIFSGDEMLISTPVWGAETMSTRTIYVLMNASSAKLLFPSVIYGSIFAPHTRFSALTTGGNINGNAVLGGLSVQRGSGFELHWFPFEAQVTGGEICFPADGCPSQPSPECPACPVCPACPEHPACPECTKCEEKNGWITGCVTPKGQYVWRLKLCDLQTGEILSVWQGCGMECFSFEANPLQDYQFCIECCCHYELRLEHLGVRSLSFPK